MRELTGSIDAELVDIRGLGAARLLSPDTADYGPPQSFAAQLHAAGTDSAVYPSVRHWDGTCIAAVWPDVVSVAQQADHYRYHWDGARVNYVRRISGDRAIYEV